MRAAWVIVVGALVFASGCAQKDWIDRTLVTENVTGVWHGSVTSASGPSIHEEVRLELEQQGPKVAGFFLGNPVLVGLRGTTPIEGSVAGDLFKFRDARGLMVGELTVGGDEMTGRGALGQYRQVTFTLWRVESANAPPR